jgi:uncharacterized protein YoxC
VAISVEDKLEEVNKFLVEVRVQQAKQEGSVNDLLGWRDVFQNNIKNALDSMDNKWEKEFNDVSRSISTINDKMDENNNELHKKLNEQGKEQEKILREATSKLPLWASVLISVILVIGGWGIEIALSVKH